MEVINPCPGNLPGQTNMMFMNFVNTFMATQCALNQENRYPEDMGPLLQNDDAFDFLVVGGGTSGSVVASRLSENNNFKILLLEAGGIPSAATKVPGFRIAITQTAEDYDYKTEPTPYACLGTNRKQCSLISGKMMGGSSAINGMTYLRGHPKDYNDWSAAGNPGWDWNSVINYFKKGEKMLDANYAAEYGTSGPLPLIPGQFRGTMRDVILNASKELGYELNKYEGSVGFFDGFMHIQNGERISTSEAYISNIQPRPNLNIAYNAVVTKVLFNDKKAYAVLCQIGNKTVKIRARKEVILSAGTIGTPHILLNSGVGPNKHLKEMKIKSVKNLPVGDNLQDQYFAPLPYIKLAPTVAPPPSENSIYNFFWNRRGPLSNNNAYSFTAFLNTEKESDQPFNLQLYHFFHSRNNTPVFGKYMNNSDYLEEISSYLLDAVKTHFTLNIVPTVLKPVSKGKIRLRSNNPLDRPRIFTNHISDVGNKDIKILLDGVRLVLELTKTASFAPYVEGILDVPIPNCKNLTFDSDEYWICNIRNLGYSANNLVGTCKMGPKTDETSVVGSDLKIHGLQNIRVVDASVIPTMTSGSVLAPSIMIAEKGSDIIKSQNA